MRTVFVRVYFEFMHFIPTLRPRSALRGHTARVTVFVSNDGGGDVVIDIGRLREAVESVVGRLRNRVLVSGDRVEGGAIRFGEYLIKVPPDQLLPLGFEPTIENVAKYIACEVAELLGGLRVKAVLDENWYAGAEATCGADT